MEGGRDVAEEGSATFASKLTAVGADEGFGDVEED